MQMLIRQVLKTASCTRIKFEQRKTGGQEYLDLSEQAAALLPDITGCDPDERVFKGLKYSTYHNVALLQQCMAAGIDKHITFHCLSRNKVADLVPQFYSDYTLAIW